MIPYVSPEHGSIDELRPFSSIELNNPQKLFESRELPSTPPIPAVQIWSNNAINIFYCSLYVLLQINSVVLVRKLEYRSVLQGAVLFVIALFMELLLIIQPFEIMKWIRCWNTLSGRGIVLSVFSVFALNGSFVIGIVTLMLSLAVLLSAIVFNSDAVIGKPFVNYKQLFHQTSYVDGGRSCANDEIYFDVV
jgi:hypothetical protein